MFIRAADDGFGESEGQEGTRRIRVVCSSGEEKSAARGREDNSRIGRRGDDRGSDGRSAKFGWEAESVSDGRDRNVRMRLTRPSFFRRLRAHL